MAYETVLLVNRDDCMRLSAINGNIDETKILPHIKTAQDIHLQIILGTKLMDKCKQIVYDDDLTNPDNSEYKLLIEEYITPVLVFYSMVDYLPFSLYEVANGGIFRHINEDSITAEENEMNSLVARFKDKAMFYSRRLEEYLCDKGSTVFPELITNLDSDIDPQSGYDFSGGWNLDPVCSRSPYTPNGMRSKENPRWRKMYDI